MNQTAVIPILDLQQEVEELWEPINAAIQSVLRSGNFIMGKEVEIFEREIADYLNVRHAVGLNSGTDALVIALRALGVGPGDEVITTPFSFFATAESISSVGATPVFVDIAEDTLNIDVERIPAAITTRTKAIMPVHLFGRPAPMGQIMEIALEYGLRVIEDCAQSFGARCTGCKECSCRTDGSESGKFTGAIGDIGAFSFFPSKNLGAYGDGGLIVTDDDAIAEQTRMLRAHGSRKRYHNEMIGYNSRLDTLQAAILRVKLPHLEAWNLARRQAAARYNELLGGLTGVEVPTIDEGHVFHQYTVCLTSANRDLVQERMLEHGVSSMVYYPFPQHLLPVYRGQYPGYPVSELKASQVLSLPIWPKISAETQRKVAQALTDALAN